ncbi:MAG: cellulase [Burkholderiaceae bacterium]|nr:cellulase [Burkholderiaceae bacterium]
MMKKLLLTALIGLGLGAQAQAWDQWEAFKQTSIESARVIDHSDSRLITTSEGQSYALFFALVANDRVAFDEILQWTEKNLSAGSLEKTAPAWLWGKDVKKGRVTWKVLDVNNAVDSDMWIAYSLLEAGRLWNRPDYTAKAHGMLKALQSQIRYIRNLGHVLLPGRYGFENETEIILNPSYYPLFILKRFALEDASWSKVYDGSLRVILRSSPDGFVPDWVRFDREGNLILGKESIGSYNAIRTYLWASMLSQRDPSYELLKRHFENMIEATKRLHMPPERVDLQTLQINGTGPDGFGACMLAYLGADRSASLIRTVLNQRELLKDAYYGNVLTLFGLGFDRKHFAFCPDGHLVLE